MRSEKNQRERCGIPECTRAAYCRGRCQRHYISSLAERKVSGLQKPDTPSRPRFEWAGDEASLIAKCEEEANV
jgi:hypothetical protein